MSNSWRSNLIYLLLIGARLMNIVPYSAILHLATDIHLHFSFGTDTHSTLRRRPCSHLDPLLLHITRKIMLFNPTTKRTFKRYSFKYLFNIEPITAPYVVADTTPVVGEVLIGILSGNDNISSSVSTTTGDPRDLDAYTFVLLPLQCAPFNLRFAYQYIGNTFKGINTNSAYKIHNIVKLSNRDSTATPCFQFYDIAPCRIPLGIPSQYEYEPIKIIYFIIIILLLDHMLVLVV